MSSPEQIQAEIEETRAKMSSDVDRLSDKVTPSKVMGRRWTTSSPAQPPYVIA